MRSAIFPILALLTLAGCAGEQPTEAPATPPPMTTAELYHVPDFARVPFVPPIRAEAVAIALREWRAFGRLVDDDPPQSRPPLDADGMPDRMPGLWQRVGEYWWIGQNSNRPETAWTGKHDEIGSQFDARRHDDFAWSAAFVSYVMRTAGAGDRFPYSPSHFVYINAAARQARGKDTGWIITARQPADYAPLPGDIICVGRQRALHMRFERLPARPFASHCDIVVAAEPGQLSVVGGNVDSAVTLKHVPTMPDGRLADPRGTVLDARYDWFVVLQVAYDR